MATPSNILAWRIPQTEEPSGLQSIRSRRVGHDRSDFATTKTPRGRIRTLVNCSLKCKMVQSLWETLRWYLKELKIDLP